MQVMRGWDFWRKRVAGALALGIGVWMWLGLLGSPRPALAGLGVAIVVALVEWGLSVLVMGKSSDGRSA